MTMALEPPPGYAPGLALYRSAVLLLDYEGVAPVISAPIRAFAALVQRAKILCQGMTVRAQKLKVTFRVIIRVTVDVVNGKRNSSCCRMPFRPTTSSAAIVVLLKEVSSNVARHGTVVTTPLVLAFLPGSDKRLIRMVTLTPNGTILWVTRLLSTRWTPNVGNRRLVSAKNTSIMMTKRRTHKTILSRL
jgi:hypothetical protein